MVHIRILALDQSTKKTGYCLIEDGELLESGVISARNIEQMFYNLDFYIGESKAEIVLFEDIYQQRGQKVFKVLAQLQGLILSIIYSHKMKYFIIHPGTWRKELGLKERKREEQKRESQELCKKLFDREFTEDEADAVCIAYSYLSMDSKQ